MTIDQYLDIRRTITDFICNLRQYAALHKGEPAVVVLLESLVKDCKEVDELVSGLIRG